MALSVRFPVTTPPDLAGAFSSATLVSVLFLADQNYPAGGYPLKPSLFGFKNSIVAILRSGDLGGGETTAFVPLYDPTLSTLRLISQVVPSSWAEVLAGSDLSMVSVSAAVFGF